MVRRLWLAFVAAFALACGENNPTGSADPTRGGPAGGDKGARRDAPSAPRRWAFVALGDSGTGSDAQKKVANAIEGVCTKRGCNFVQLLGDNLYDSGANSVDDSIWQSHFEVPYAAINVPFYAVLGNHDYGHGGTGTDFGKGRNEIDYSARSTKWRLPAASYHHKIENGEIFALDTNKILLDGLGTSSADQETEVPKWLAASVADWKIAMGHHPYRSNGPHGNAGKYDNIFIPGPWTGAKVKSFLEKHVCGKVDLYLCAHDHSRQWLNESCSGTELAVSGAGARATELPGNNATLFQSLELGFLYIVVEGKRLTAEFIDEDGKVEFTHVITKP